LLDFSFLTPTACSYPKRPQPTTDLLVAHPGTVEVVAALLGCEAGDRCGGHAAADGATGLAGRVARCELPDRPRQQYGTQPMFRRNSWFSAPLTQFGAQPAAAEFDVNAWLLWFWTS